jgi:hypothetical protein
MAEKIRQQIEARRQQREEKEKMKNYQPIKPAEDPVEKIINSDRDHLDQLNLDENDRNAQLICYERRIITSEIWFAKSAKLLVDIDNYNLRHIAFIELKHALDTYMQEMKYARCGRGISDRTKLACRNLLQAKITWDCEWRKLWKADFDQEINRAWLEFKVTRCEDACYHLYDDDIEPRSDIQINDQNKNQITVKLRILHRVNRDIYAGTLLMDSNSIKISLDADTTYTETIDASKLDNTIMLRQWIETMLEAVQILEKLVDCKLKADQTNGISVPFSWSEPSVETAV